MRGKGRQVLQLGGCQPRPPPPQKLKISPNGWRLLVDEMLLYLFAKFELYLYHIFRENRRWNHEYSILDTIDAKLRDQRIRSMQAVLNLPISAWLDFESLSWEVAALIGRPRCNMDMQFSKLYSWPSYILFVSSQQLLTTNTWCGLPVG